jgi:cytochrome c peroxidase
MRRVLGALALALTLAGAAGAAGAAGVDFTPAEKQAIARHGPWPPPLRKDASNRHSGKPAAIAFGRKLFFDARLSLEGKLACASCHLPSRAWADAQPRSFGRMLLDRNAPSIVNARFERWFGRDGGADSLWGHAILPLTDEREMAMTPALLAAAIRDHRDLDAAYRRAFGRPGNDEDVMVNLAKALAAFQETVVTRRTPFDAFRDALLRNDRQAMARYPQAAQRGLRIFVGRGNCAICHFGPTFSNGEFADVGIPFFAAPGRVDPGRHAGIRQVAESPFNLLGRHNDDPTRANAVATRHLRLEHRHWGEFKVPGLRDVARTAPYMHAGSLATLADVIAHYSALNEDRLHADGERILRPLRLDPGEAADLAAFLETLSSAPAPPRRERRAANGRP